MKTLCKGLILFLALVLLTSQTAMSKELIIAMHEEIRGTDIQQIGRSTVVHSLLFEPPFRFTRDMNSIEPGFVSGFSLSKDGKTLRLTIADGLTFSNGIPLTPEAIKASYERYLKVSPYASDFKSLYDITIENNDVVMHWKNPPVPVLVVLASAFGGVVDVTTANKVGEEKFNRNVVAYGPMVVDEWVQGSHITLKRNPNFRTYFPEFKNKGPMNIDKVTVRFIPDDFIRVTEIKSGSTDIIYGVPLENVEELKADPDIELHRNLQTGCMMYYVNPNDTILSDAKVRRALQRGVNRQELVTLLNSNNAQVRFGLFSPSIIGFHQGAEDRFAKLYRYDFEAASRLLDEAGWKDTDGDGIRDKDGKKLQITAMVAIDSPGVRKTAPVIQAQYKKLGVALKLQEFEDKYIRQAVRDKKNQLASRRWQWFDGDMLTYLFHSDSRNYADPDIDALINAARYEIYPQKRAEIYAQAQGLILEKGLAIPLYSDFYYVAVRKGIKGFVMSANGTVYLNDLEKE